MAVGTALVAVGDALAPATFAWCGAPVHPLARKTLTVRRGALARGELATLTLEVAGPRLDAPLVVVSTTVQLDDVQHWDVRLDYAHSELVPGTWRYVARLSSGDVSLLSPSLEYTLLPFFFGA